MGLESATPIAEWLRGQPELLRFFTPLVWKWEALGWMMAYSPLWWEFAREICVLGYFTMHWGFGMALSIGTFILIPPALSVSQLPPLTWHRLREWLYGDEEPIVVSVPQQYHYTTLVFSEFFLSRKTVVKVGDVTGIVVHSNHGTAEGASAILQHSPLLWFLSPLLAFIPQRTAHFSERLLRFLAPTSPSPRPSHSPKLFTLRNAFLCYCILNSYLYLQSGLNGGELLREFPWLRQTAWLLRIDQNWGLFAPDPPGVSGWLVRF